MMPLSPRFVRKSDAFQSHLGKELRQTPPAGHSLALRPAGSTQASCLPKDLYPRVRFTVPISDQDPEYPPGCISSSSLVWITPQWYHCKNIHPVYFHSHVFLVQNILYRLARTGILSTGSPMFLSILLQPFLWLSLVTVCHPIYLIYHEYLLMVTPI